MFRMMKNQYEAVEPEFDEDFSVSSLEFGSIIAKGSYGVVYEAREKSNSGRFMKLYKATRVWNQNLSTPVSLINCSVVKLNACFLFSLKHVI